MEKGRPRLDRNTHIKAYVLLGIFACVVIYIIYVLFNMQVISYADYQGKVADQMTTEVKVNPERGDIYDTNGNLLATNTTRYLVFISPQDIIDAMKEVDENNATPVFEWENFEGKRESGLKMDEIISKYLSGVIEGVDYDTVLEKCGKEGRRYEVIAKEIGEDVADQIRQFKEEYGFDRQIYLVASSMRYYPYGSLASHVIGFTDLDGKGIYGLEYYYNNVMEGTSGRYITAQDAKNNEMPFEYETYVEAENGYRIGTTLDVYIQYELENQLEAALKDHKVANRVCGIVMNVKTGGVLAMAVAPTFDLNDPRTLDSLSQSVLAQYTEGTDEYNKARLELLYTMWKNKAVTETYEPGSTFKIMTTAMALEEKAVRTDEMFYCPGYMRVEGYPEPIRCHKAGGHGSVTFRVGLQQSCNPTLMTIGLRVGQEKFYRYFDQFGYKSTTGIDVPNEATTISHAYKDFTIPSLAVYSFGQTFKTTPIQQITAIASVANGGNLVTPHFLKEITDDDGNVIESFGTDVKRQVISKETCDTITEILEEGVSGNGGARNAYVKGYKVAAKTGTSQKRDKMDENGEDTLRVGSCVAYAPADDPQIAVLIMVDEPMGGVEYGSVVAAPYVSNLLSFILPYLGYEPSYTEEEMKYDEVTVSNYVGSSVANAENDLSWRKINYKIVGDGDTVKAQTPDGGSSFTKDSGVLYLYTDESLVKAEITMPDLVGKTAEAANRIVTNLGLNVRISGATNGAAATVRAQSPAAGEVVPVGTLVTVEMRHSITSDD